MANVVVYENLYGMKIPVQCPHCYEDLRKVNVQILYDFLSSTYWCIAKVRRDGNILKPNQSFIPIEMLASAQSILYGREIHCNHCEGFVALV